MGSPEGVQPIANLIAVLLNEGPVTGFLNQERYEALAVAGRPRSGRMHHSPANNEVTT